MLALRELIGSGIFNTKRIDDDLLLFVNCLLSD